MNDPIISTINWVYFCFNYDLNFIPKCWAGDQRMIDHLESKFLGYFNQYGSHSVMNHFMLNLDSDNQIKLAEWVNQNYTYGYSGSGS